jgi:hypothetical protein
MLDQKKTVNTTKIQAGDQPNFADPKPNVGQDDYCIQCGRKVGADAWLVEIIEGGFIRLQDGSEYDKASDPGYMGCYAIGNECAKKFAPNLLIKRGA